MDLCYLKKIVKIHIYSVPEKLTCSYHSYTKVNFGKFFWGKLSSWRRTYLGPYQYAKGAYKSRWLRQYTWKNIFILCYSSGQQSSIWETLNISMCADNSNNTKTDRNQQKGKERKKCHLSRVRCQTRRLKLKPFGYYWRLRAMGQTDGQCNY